MNLFTCTARIVTTPSLSFKVNRPLTQMILCIHNNKRRSIWYPVYAKVIGSLAHKVFDIYHLGDVVIIQGSIKLKIEKLNVSKKESKTKKYIILNINKIYSANS